MKKRFRTSLAFLLALILLITSLPVSAATADPYTLWLSPSNPEDSSIPIDAVKWWKYDVDQCYYLFMPSETPEIQQLYIDGADSVCIDNVYYTNNSSICLSAGTHSVQFGADSYTLKVMQSANIGSMYITTKTGSMDFVHASKENKDKGTMRMVSADGKKVYYNGDLTQIKGRGNATWGKPKKPYQIKTDKKVELVEGAGKHKTWLLLANYCEQTMIRNNFAYNLALDAGLANSCMMSYVDLYCNNIYMGTYSVCEKVEIGDNRVEIEDLEGATEDVNEKDLDSYEWYGENKAVAGTSKGYLIPNNPDDITGGYLLEMEASDRYPNEVSGFVTTRGQPIVIKEPEYASKEQVDYISNYFQEFEDALFSDSGYHPTNGKHYTEYFELSTMARKYIIEELTKNIDANKTSQFFYKPSDRESTTGFCGPVWDYDNALANFSGSSDATPEGLYAINRTSVNYYKQMTEKEDFIDAVRAEWNSSFLPYIREFLGETASDPSTYTIPMSELFEMLSPSAAMNYVVWDEAMLEKNIYNVYTGGPTYAGAFEYLKNFISKRTDWLSDYWQIEDIDALPVGSSNRNEIRSILEYNGTGTYAISSEEELQYAADLVTAGNTLSGTTLLQTADITLTKDFTPGGNADHVPSSFSGYQYVFRGTFNGQGYQIYNLQIHEPDRNGVGLFACSYKATFTDVHIASGSVSGKARVGGITGYGDICTFTRCSNGASVSASETDAAGIAGSARQSSVFTSCYNTGAISGATGLAGIAGWGQNNITVTNSYNSGTITATAKKDCSVIARTSVATAFNTCYASEGCISEGEDPNTVNTVKTSALTDGTLLAALNGTDGTTWAAGTDFPVHAAVSKVPLATLTVIQWQGKEKLSSAISYLPTGTVITPAELTSHFCIGTKINGTAYTEETFTVNGNTTLEFDLTTTIPLFAHYNGAGSYLLKGDELQALLTLSQTTDLSNSTFYLIGNANGTTITTSGGIFNGTLNGLGNAIIGLQVPLFDTVGENGQIKKLTLQNADIQGAGAVAQTNLGKITYVTVKGVCIRSEKAAGGLVGINSGHIGACSVDGYLIAETLAGGIAATNNGVIRNSINNARLISLNGKGAGIFASGNGTAVNCLSLGDLNTSSADVVASGKQINCYALDLVLGTAGEETVLNTVELQSAKLVEQLGEPCWITGETMPEIRLTTYELGDVNDDGTVSIVDAIMLLQYLCGSLKESELNLDNADITGDGNYMNATVMILRHLIGRAEL